MPKHEVVRWEGQAEPDYDWYVLPLNGEWSDLTATFECSGATAPSC